MNRQAATCKGLERRVRDLAFGRVTDPRVARKVKVPLPALLAALVTGMVTKARSLRQVEQRTAQLARQQGRWLGVSGRIADNTFGKVIPRLRWAELVTGLQRLVKAEHRRGNLRLDPHGVGRGAIAIDGKNSVTLHWPDLCRVLELEPRTATAAEVRGPLAARYPEAQLCEPQEGKPYALLRVHTVTLISAAAAPCIHLRQIPGDTNEIGALPDLLEDLSTVYGRTRLFEVVTTDAGNTSRGGCAQIAAAGWKYFSQIKSEHGDLHAEAVRVLGERRRARAHSTCTDKQHGAVVTYYVWCYDLGDEGWLDWTHARQLVRVQRVTDNPTTGEHTVGNRFYVTNLPRTAVGPATAGRLSRAHWRCEDEIHWTADAELKEDRRRPAWSRHPHGVLVVGALRMIALCILAVARRLSRLGYSHETPSWHQVSEHFLLELCGSVLELAAFDNV